MRTRIDVNIHPIAGYTIDTRGFNYKLAHIGDTLLCPLSRFEDHNYATGRKGRRVRCRWHLVRWARCLVEKESMTADAKRLYMYWIESMRLHVALGQHTEIDYSYIDRS